MDENSVKLLNDIKVDIRSIVMSNPNVMDMNTLIRDYRSTNGSGLPFGKFGYTNLQTFLRRECQDVVELSGDYYNPYLTPVVTEKVRHVNEMIQKQKSSKFSGFNTPRRAIIKSSISSISSRTNRLQKITDASLWRPKTERASKPVALMDLNFKTQPQLTKNITSSSSNTISSSRDKKGEQPKNPKVPKKLIENLTELMDAYPGGLWCRELPQAYKKKFLVDLQIQHSGYFTAHTMCKDLSMVFQMTRPTTTSDWLLFPLNVEIPPQKRIGAGEGQTNFNNEEVDIDELVSGSIALPGVKPDPSLYPKDCASYGKRLPNPQSLPDSCLVEITEVKDMSYFWFHVKSINRTGELERIMIEMTNFYRTDPSATDYHMIRAVAKTGQLCAVPYEMGGGYHRAVIIKNVSIEEVKVYFVDYGSTRNVKFAQLRMLLSKYCELPIQGQRGRLAGISPKGNSWSPDALQRFMGLVSDKQLQGKMINQVVKDNFPVTLLELTNTYEEVNVGDVLISEGLVVASKDEDLKPGCHQRFEEIENGEKVEEKEVQVEEKEVQREDKNSDIKKLIKKYVNIHNENDVKNVTDARREDFSNSSVISDVSKTVSDDLDYEDSFDHPEEFNNECKIESLNTPGCREDDIHDLVNLRQQFYISNNYPINPPMIPLPQYPILPVNQLVLPFQNPHIPLRPVAMPYAYLPNVNNPAFYHTWPRPPFNGLVSSSPPLRFPVVNRNFQGHGNVRVKRPESEFRGIVDNKNTRSYLRQSDFEKKFYTNSYNNYDSSISKYADEPLTKIEENIKSISKHTSVDSLNKKDLIGGKDKNSMCDLDDEEDLVKGETPLVEGKAPLMEGKTPLVEGKTPLAEEDTSLFTQYFLILVAVSGLFQNPVEIWHVLEKPYVMLEQCAMAFFNVKDVDTVCKQFNELNSDGHMLSIVLQDKNNGEVNRTLSKISKCNRSGCIENDILIIKSLNQVDVSQPYITLLGVNDLLLYLGHFPKLLKHNMLYVMQSIYDLSDNYYLSETDSED